MIDNRLFISDYYRNAIETICGVVLRESEEQIVGTDANDLAQFYIQDFEFAPDDEPLWKHENYVKTIPSHQRDSFYRNAGNVDFSCERIIVVVPIKHNKDRLS